MRDTGEVKIKAYLIRHGITQGNLEKRYVGASDVDLCGEGEEQIRKNAADGMYPPVDMLFISPLVRCRQTAGIIYPDMEPIVVDSLREMNFGDFEGRNYNDLSDNPVYQAFIDSNGELAFPNGEEKKEFAGRIMGGLKEAFETAAKNGAEKIALVVHGGTIMAACAGMGLAEYFDSIVPNGGVLEIDITYDLSHNGTFSGVLA